MRNTKRTNITDIYSERSMFPANGLASAEKRANIPYTYRVALGVNSGHTSNRECIN